MDGGASDLELLLATARQELAELRDDPRLAEVLDGRGKSLKSHVLDLLGAVEHRMAEAPSAGTETAKRAYAREIRRGISMLHAAHAALPWLAETQQPTLNLGSLYMTEEFARVLVGREVDLVVIANPEYMYSTTSWPFRHAIKQTPGFSPKTTQRPIVLYYPLCDSNRLLLHPVFAHELGHAGVSEHRLVESVYRKFLSDPSFATSFAAAVGDLFERWPGKSESNLSGLLERRLLTWIEELICDHLAIEVAGPAYLWAFAMFAMPFSYGDPAEDHPPNTVRLHLMLEQLDRRGWTPYLEEVAPNVSRWLSEVAADAGNELGAEFEFLRDRALSHAELFREAAAERTGSGALDRTSAESGASQAAMLLSSTILPLGLDGPIDGRAILLGGWQHAFRGDGDSPEGMVHALADEGLQDLLGKAIEMSIVVEAWREDP